MIRPPADARRLVYLGTPDAAVPPLQALHAAGFDIPLVVTSVDKRRGRRGHSEPSPVKACAVELGLAVSHDVDDVLATGCQLGVVVAYGRLIRPHVLEQLPFVNVHFSLLPRWRGAAPVERAILAGDERTGVCLMALEETLDTGPVYRVVETPIGDRENADELRQRLVTLGTDLLVGALRAGLGDPTEQEGEPTYAAKIETAELEIDWSQPAEEIDRVVRVGGAWTTLDGVRLKIWSTGAPLVSDLAPGQVDGPLVGTGDGALALQVVQAASRPRLGIDAFLAGARLEAGARLGT